MNITADNYRLSKPEHSRLISTKDWAKLGWEQFQSLVCDYLHACFGEEAGIKIVTTGTGGPDGGRDFELVFTSPRGAQKVYVECKHHKDSLGLDTLGKYLIVVLINRAAELFIVSSSPITEGARAQFIQAAEHMNVSLSLIDGEHLDCELSKHPEVLSKYFPHLSSAARRDFSPLDVSLHVRPFAEIDPSQQLQRKRVKLYDDQFYVHVLLKNRSSSEVEIIDIQVPNFDHALTISPDRGLPIQRTLNSMQDASAIYFCRMRGSDAQLSGGEVSVKVRIARAIKTIRFGLPVLDFSSLTTPPLVGESTIGFLKERAPKICDDVQAGEGRLIDIRGVSGVGKSRLLHELSAQFLQEGFTTLRYDAIRQKDTVFRRLIADLAVLPLFKGSLLQATSQLTRLLRARGCAAEYADDVEDFLLHEEVAWSKLYSIAETLKHMLKNPVRDRPIALVIDNVQEVSPTALRVLLQICDFLFESELRVCLILASNTEVMPENIITPLSEFHDRLDSFGQAAFRTRFDVEPLTEFDAKVLLHSLLHPGYSRTQNQELAVGDAVIEMLTKKAGTRPLDLLMAVQWLEETGAIRRRGSLAWFITDFKRFSETILLVPRGSATLIRKRLQAISVRVTPARWRRIRDTLRYLVAFSGRIPTSFLTRRIPRFAIEFLLDHSILRQEFESSMEHVVAFHDNIYRYLSSTQSWHASQKQSKLVLEWIAGQSDVNRDDLALVELFNAIEISAPAETVIKIGERALSRSESRSPGDALEASRRLSRFLDRIDLATTDFDRYLPIKLYYANALLHQAAVTEALQEFDDLYRHVQTGALKDTTARDRFYHKFINANLHSAQHKRALEILEYRFLNPPEDPEFVFLLYDRFGVAYTGIGGADEAEAWLDRATKVSKEHLRSDWESIAYYDIAHIHIYVTFDKDRTLFSLHQSVEAYNRSAEKPVWRQVEIAKTESLIDLLEGRLTSALEKAENALWLSKRAGELYSQIKVLNLLGTCHVLADHLSTARIVFAQGRSLAAMSFNDRAFWRAIANLGTVAALEGDSLAALEHFAEAESFLRRKISQNSAIARELPILTNYLVLCAETGEKAVINELLHAWDDRRLKRFASELSGRMPRNWRRVLGIVQHRGFALLPS